MFTCLVSDTSRNVNTKANGNVSSNYYVLLVCRNADRRNLTIIESYLGLRSLTVNSEGLKFKSYLLQQKFVNFLG